MIKWHEKKLASFGLRLAGMALLASAWWEVGILRTLVTEQPAAEATAVQMLLAGLMFISLSFGSALLVLGSALWTPVMVSERWAAYVPIPVVRDMKA